MNFEFDIQENIAILVKYNGQDNHVVVPPAYQGSTVKAIGARAFANSHISSVLLPDSVDTIGDHAFHGCSFLEWIGCEERMFRQYSVIKASRIGKGAFSRTGLGDVLLSSGTDLYIESDAFAGCPKLCNVQFIDNASVHLDSRCFAQSGIETIVLPTHKFILDKIPDQCFYECHHLKNICFSAVRIGIEAFSGCRSLRTIPLNEGLREIGASAFYQCSGITTLNIPKSLQYFSADSFVETGISHFQVHLDNPHFVSDENGAILNGNRDTLLVFPPAVTTTPILKEGIKTIGRSAFQGSKICHIGLPNSLKAIEADSFRNSALVALTLPSDIEHIGPAAFANCNFIDVYIPAGVEIFLESAFYNTFVHIVHYQGTPAEFKKYIDGTFLNENVEVYFLNQETGEEYQVGIKKANLLFEYTVYDNGTCRINEVFPMFNHIVIPSTINGKTVVAIDTFAFPFCTDSAFIPNTVKEIECGAFSNAVFLKKIYVYKDFYIDPIELPQRCQVERYWEG